MRVWRPSVEGCPGAPAADQVEELREGNRTKEAAVDQLRGQLRAAETARAEHEATIAQLTARLDAVQRVGDTGHRLPLEWRCPR